VLRWVFGGTRGQRRDGGAGGRRQVRWRAVHCDRGIALADECRRVAEAAPAGGPNRVASHEPCQAPTTKPIARANNDDVTIETSATCAVLGESQPQRRAGAECHACRAIDAPERDEFGPPHAFDDAPVDPALERNDPIHVGACRYQLEHWRKHDSIDGRARRALPQVLEKWRAQDPFLDVIKLDDKDAAAGGELDLRLAAPRGRGPDRDRSRSLRAWLQPNGGNSISGIGARSQRSHLAAHSRHRLPLLGCNLLRIQRRRPHADQGCPELCLERRRDMVGSFTWGGPGMGHIGRVGFLRL
jgi:hypothetical protein